jgi:hypothetical protein
MRIFSKTHDYYDGVGGYDSDPKRVFNRPEPKTIYNNELSCKNYARRTFASNFFVVGFCGEIYPGYLNDHINNDDKIYIYDYDNLPKEKLSQKYTGSIYYETDFNDKFFQGWFKKEIWNYRGTTSFKNEYNDIFLKYHVPYFVVHENGVKLYPSLKDIQFYKVFDAYSCYQKIDSYLFNELVPPDIIDYEPADKLKVQSHGFDQFSFRKEKK